MSIWTVDRQPFCRWVYQYDMTTQVVSSFDNLPVICINLKLATAHGISGRNGIQWWSFIYIRQYVNIIYIYMYAYIYVCIIYINIYKHPYSNYYTVLSSRWSFQKTYVCWMLLLHDNHANWSSSFSSKSGNIGMFRRPLTGHRRNITGVSPVSSGFQTIYSLLSYSDIPLLRIPEFRMTGDWPPCFFLSGNLSTSQRFDLHFPHNSSRNPEMPWSWKYHPHLRLPKSSDSMKSKSHPSLFTKLI